MKNSYTVTEDVLVKNENGTAKLNDNNCGSWLQHWKNYGGNDDTPLCCISGCFNIAGHGAHVTRPNAKNEDYKTHLYIVPNVNIILYSFPYFRLNFVCSVCWFTIIQN